MRTWHTSLLSSDALQQRRQPFWELQVNAYTLCAKYESGAESLNPAIGLLCWALCLNMFLILMLLFRLKIINDFWENSPWTVCRRIQLDVAIPNPCCAISQEKEGATDCTNPLVGVAALRFCCSGVRNFRDRPPIRLERPRWGNQGGSSISSQP